MSEISASSHTLWGLIWGKVYRNLTVSKTEIRLVYLQPSHSFDDPIEVDVNVQDPARGPFDYDAISYRWGDLGERSEIRLNCTMQFSITKSLYLALKHLRSRTDLVVIWADGICIDQSNTEERNTQVALMGQIFSRASRVRIFLGTADDDDDVPAAMKLIRDCAFMYEDSGVVSRVLCDEKGSIALTRLLARSYWQRMWVFQEIILGRHNIIHCGQFEAPWQGLLNLDRVSGDARYWYQSQVRHCWLRSLRDALFNVSPFCMQQKHARHLTNVLLPTRGLESTDPRDKLFALMGISDFGNTLAVDYTKSARDIYVMFTRNYINQEKGGDLAFLLMAGLCQVNKAEDIGLPSWTPDFRGLQGVDTRYLAASYLNQFNACGENAQSVSFLDDHHTMKADGVVLGKVHKILALEKGEECRGEILSTFTSETTNLPEGASRVSYRDIFDMFIFYDIVMGGCRVDDDAIRRHKQERLTRLVYGFTYDVEKITSSSLKAQERIKTLTTEFLDSFYIFGLKDLDKEYETLRSSHDSDRIHWFREEFLSRYREGFDDVQATAFSTVGGYFGKGPGILEEGDQIAIAHGCKVPLALRPAGDGEGLFRLIGPCYISGMMNGEAFRTVKGIPSPLTTNICIV